MNLDLDSLDRLVATDNARASYNVFSWNRLVVTKWKRARELQHSVIQHSSGNRIKQAPWDMTKQLGTVDILGIVSPSKNSFSST